MQMILQGFGQRICQEQTAGASDFHARTSALQENSRVSQDSVLACFLQLQALLEDRRKKINPLAYSLKTLKTYLVLTEGLILQGSSWSWMKSGTMQSGRFSTLPMSSLKTEKEFSLLDILEDEVPEKYFLSEQTVKRLISYKDNVLMRLPTRTGGNATVGCYPLVKSKQHEKGLKLVALIDGENKQANRIYSPDGISPTLNTGTGGRLEPKFILSDKDGYRVRKLTPRECFRLQGFPDDYFDRAKEVCSDSQLYKQAGNSVTVPVVYEIAKRMEIGE